MSFLFPRTVRLSRPNGDPGTGARPYSGLLQANETAILTTSAHIQPDRQGKPPLEGLPGDAVGQPTWKLILKLPLGTVRKRDVLTDDLGTRYQVAYSAWTPLGTTVLAVELNGPGPPASLLLPFPAAAWGATAGNWESLTDPWAAPTAWPGTTPNWDATTTNWESLA